MSAIGFVVMICGALVCGYAMLMDDWAAAMGVSWLIGGPLMLIGIALVKLDVRRG